MTAGRRNFVADLAIYLRDFIKNLFARPSDPPAIAGVPPEGRRAALLAGAVALFLVAYVLPLPILLGHNDGLVSLVAVAAFFLGAFAMYWLCSVSPTKRIHHLARTAAQRTGLLWSERCCMLLALIAMIVAAGNYGEAVPLVVLTGGGFLALAGGEYRERELGGPLPDIIFTPPDPTELKDASKFVDRDFRWSLAIADDNHSGRVTLPVSIATYEQARKENPKFEHGPNREPRFGRWLTDFPSAEVARLTAELNHVAGERNLSRFARIANVLAFVQAIKYASDEETTGHPEYWRYPIETLYDECGDCDDSSLLAAAVLRRMGYDVAMAYTDDHAAVAVAAPPGLPGSYIRDGDGKPYYYCETTTTGWHVGEIPPEQNEASVRLLPI